MLPVSDRPLFLIKLSYVIQLVYLSQISNAILLEKGNYAHISLLALKTGDADRFRALLIPSWSAVMGSDFAA
jgi:hypothetical protein